MIVSGDVLQMKRSMGDLMLDLIEQDSESELPDSTKELCDICYEERPPETLPCGHTFCRTVSSSPPLLFLDSLADLVLFLVYSTTLTSFVDRREGLGHGVSGCGL